MPTVLRHGPYSFVFFSSDRGEPPHIHAKHDRQIAKFWHWHVTTLVLEQDPAAVNVTLTDDGLIVELADGRSLTVPLAWYPRLLHGSPVERRNWQLLGDGYAVEWPDLDEHIGVEGLLAGRRSGENKSSFNRWLASRKSRP